MGELINGRTPEEIKRILRWINFDCADHECESCPNEDICSLQNSNEGVLAKNALDLIERLESERDAALAKVPKWISVKDRLPQAEERVLLMTEEMGTRKVKWKNVMCGFYEDGNVWCEDSRVCWERSVLANYDEDRDDYRIPEGFFEECINEIDDYNCVAIGDRITHWMPLPKPPEEE